jgi:hypothetical protein
MAKKRLTFVALLLVTTFLQVQDALPSTLTFTAETGGSTYFTGNSEKFLKVNTSNLNMSDRNFTISWWQYLDGPISSLYPRILQFGHGHEFTDKFAISEESDGNIYLWINGMNITSMPIPNFDQSVWSHIAIERNGANYSWFVDGLLVKATNFEGALVDNPAVLGGPSFMRAQYDTTGLDLLIGSGDDAETGGYIGNLAGVQISQSVRWDPETDFTPPTNFLNPGTGFAFSMYVSDQDVLDKSGNDLLVMPTATSYGELADNFNPPGVIPDPPAPPTDLPDGPSYLLNWDDYDEWNSLLEISKPEDIYAQYDYRQIKTLAIGIPLIYHDANNQLIKTKCYIDLAGDWHTSLNGSEISINLESYFSFIINNFPFECHAAPTPSHPTGYNDIPEYQPGMFGTQSVNLDFVLWTQPPNDISDVGSAYEKLSYTLRIPPEVISHSIARGDNSETDPNRISFGDTITATVTNVTAIASVAMMFGVPEIHRSGDQNVCYYNFQPNQDGTWGPTFALPTLEEFLTQCRMQYNGDWTFDLTADRFFALQFFDDQQNSMPDAFLTLNAINPLQVPEISGHTITRVNNSETNPNKLHSRDIINFTFDNSSDLSYLGFFINVPEAFGPGKPLDSWNWCYIPIEPDSNNVFGENVTVPSAAQISSHCHGDGWYTGNWTFDESISRRIEINVENSARNYTRYQALTFAPLTQNTPTPPVVRVPGAPTALVAETTGKRSALVRFSAPVSDGGSAVTSYTATSTPGGLSKTLTQSAGGIFDFDNLQPGTTYTFAVTATNATGTSVSATSNLITTIPLLVASLSSLSFIDDETGTGGKIVWSGKNIDSVLYAGPISSYPGPYSYGAFTSSWNGRIRNLTADTEYIISIYAISADGVGELKSLAFKTSTTLPNLSGAANDTTSIQNSVTKLEQLLKWVEENTFVPGEAVNMSKLLLKFDALETSAHRSYIKVPTSRVSNVDVRSLTPKACSVISASAKVDAGLVTALSGDKCTISYTVAGGSKAPATLIKDFFFKKYVK